MVFSMVMMATMLPTMIGLNEATQNSRDQEETRRETARRQRVNLMATCDMGEGSLEQRQQIHNARVYWAPDGRVSPSHASPGTGPSNPREQFYITKNPPEGFVPLNGRFYQHPLFPPDNLAGFVTMSGETPAVLRWVFVDADTHEVRWGGRQDSDGHLCGPFNWTTDEKRTTLDGWEGWLAVRLPDDPSAAGLWRLYFDQHDDGAGLPAGSQGLEICLTRVPADS